MNKQLETNWVPKGWFLCKVSQKLLQEVKDGMKHCTKGSPAACWLAKSTGAKVKEDVI